MRTAVTAALMLIMRIFFRRIEALGLEKIPTDAPVIFALNHPNGLLDPLLILGYSPKPVVFLAKSTLFKMPFVGWVCRAIEAIPVYRTQDREAGGLRDNAKKNLETFGRTRELLTQGRAVALFPEGVSHSDPRLKPLKTGAARIALGAHLNGLCIVPAGISYTSKATFRSQVLIHFGEPIAVNAEHATGDLAPADEPSREATQALTDRIREGLEAVLLQADRHEQLTLIVRAEEIYTLGSVAKRNGRRHPGLGERFELRKRFMARYAELQSQNPARTTAIETRIAAFEIDLQAHRLEPNSLTPVTGLFGRFFRPVGRALLLLLWLPFALVGIVLHYPAYRLIGFLAQRFAHGEDDLIATNKTLGAILFFALTWVLAAAGAMAAFGWRAGITTLLVAPLLGYIALVYSERLTSTLQRLRADALALFQPARYSALVLEKREIRDAIRALARN